MNLVMAWIKPHLCLKIVYIVFLFVDDKGGEIYELMLWLCHACIIENIWINDNYDCHISNMPCLHHVKISRTCIVVLRVDILPCDEMLWLLKYLKCVHHVKISKSYFKIYMLISYHMMNCYHYHHSHSKFENGCQAVTSYIIFREIHHDGNHDGSIDKVKWF